MDSRRRQVFVAQMFLFFSWLLFALSTSDFIFDVVEHLALPEEFIVRAPILFSSLPRIPESLAPVLCYFLMLLLCLLALNLVNRFFVSFAFVLWLYFFSVLQLTGISRFGTSVVTIVFFLSVFAPVAMSKKDAATVEEWQYEWLPATARQLFVLFFFLAGLNKLSNSEWFTSDSLLNNILIRYFFKVGTGHLQLGEFHLGLWLTQWPSLCKLAASLVVALELMSPFLLFKKFRLFGILAFLAFQIANYFVVNESFLYFYALYVFWIPEKYLVFLYNGLIFPRTSRQGIV